PDVHRAQVPSANDAVVPDGLIDDTAVRVRQHDRGVFHGNAIALPKSRARLYQGGIELVVLWIDRTAAITVQPGPVGAPGNEVGEGERHGEECTGCHSMGCRGDGPGTIVG